MSIQARHTDAKVRMAQRRISQQRLNASSQLCLFICSRFSSRTTLLPVCASSLQHLRRSRKRIQNEPGTNHKKNGTPDKLREKNILELHATSLLQAAPSLAQPSSSDYLA